MNTEIERMAADALLDAGISVPFFRIRLPWCKPRTLRLVMRRPYLGGQMRILRRYLTLGMTYRQIEALDEQKLVAFYASHDKCLSEMLALTICRGYLSGLILTPVVAWLIRWRVPLEYRIEAQRWFRYLASTRDFTTITTWAEMMNPLRPQVGRAANARSVIAVGRRS